MFLSLALLLAAPPADEADRRDRQSPELVVEAGGRTAVCDAVAFSPDGGTLFAAGDDKVVRAWPVGRGGLGAAAMRTLRWPAWREYRGGIKALAVSPDGSAVAVGGYGTRASVGSVGLLAWPAGELRDLFVPDRPGGGSTYTVTAVAFAPDGRSLAFGNADGSVWVWRFTAAGPGVQIGRHPAAAGREFNRVRLVAFRGPDRVVSAAESGDVREFDAAGKAADGRPLFDVMRTPGFAPKPPARLFQAVLSPDGNWLAAGCDGPTPAVVLRPLAGGAAKLAELEPGQYVDALAFDATGRRLAVAVGGVQGAAAGRGFRLEKDDRILLADDPLGPGRVAFKPGPPHAFRAEALAFHPDGRLAVAGGDHHEVTLWDLSGRQPVAGVARGAGRCLWGVRVSADGGAVGFRTGRDPAATDPNDRGAGPWLAFDLARAKPTAAAGRKWVEPAARSADGWEVEPTADRARWRVANRTANAAHDLPWDVDRDGFPRCYTFLPPAAAGGPARLAVGHTYGFSVFELAADRPPVRTMWCKGHASEVMAIAPSKDGSWVVTAGTDQTLAGWNTAPWESGNALGAALRAADGKLLVGEVAVGSPAWETGLVEGAEVKAVGVLAAGGRSVPFAVDLPAEGFAAAGTPAAGKQAVDAARPAASLFLAWTRPGGRRLFVGQTTLPTRPVWRLFPAFDDDGRVTEWVAWAWATGHYHTSTNGDSLVGWQVNRADETRPPAFHPAERLKALYHKEAEVRRLLQTRDLAGCLRAVLGDNPQPPSFAATEPAPVRLTAGPVGPDGLTVTVDVESRSTNPDLMPDTVELWVNDYRLARLPADGRPVRDRPVAIPLDALRGGDNTVTVTVRNRLGGRADAQVAVRNPRPPRRPRLFGLAVGINDYSQSKAVPPGGGGDAVGPARGGKFPDLIGARNDAEKLRERWVAQAADGRLYAAAEFGLAVDPHTTRADLLAALDRVGQAATADDRFVLFLAGHGDYLPVAAPAAGRPARKEFVFCGRDYDRTRPAATGLRAAELVDRLAALPCRKVVLLDACHSGQAASGNLIRELVPAGHGPVVFAACDQSELAFELPARGHGVFTFAVLEALGPDLPADADGDRRIDAAELAGYVAKRTRDLLKELDPKLTGDEQTPQRFPRRPEPFAVAGREPSAGRPATE